MTDKLITAAEARELDPARACAADLARLDKMIRAAAAAGNRTVRVPYELMTAKGYSATFKTPGVEEALRAAGFSIKSRSEERQFVDVWLEVSWEAAA